MGHAVGVPKTAEPVADLPARRRKRKGSEVVSPQPPVDSEVSDVVDV